MTFVVVAVLNAIATQYLDRSGCELEKSELVNFSRRSILARKAVILVSSVLRSRHELFIVVLVRHYPAVPFDHVKFGPDLLTP